jgi:hypothetical protein
VDQRTLAPVVAAPAAPAVGDEHLLLFNTATYHRLNLQPGEEFVRVDVATGPTADDRPIGTLAGILVDGEFCSGYRAPFGGPDFVRRSETVEHVGRLVDESLVRLAERGARRVRIRARSECHSPTEPSLQFTLLNAGFAVAACELNFHIDLEALGGGADADAYQAALKPAARKALRHALRLDLRFHEAATDGEWATAYAVIARNREAKGRPMRLGFPYVTAIRHAFPGRVRMYALHHARRVCAAALVYRVRPGHDYVVAWGDHGHDLPRSPMNVLALRVVERALAEGVAIVDLGISSEDGRPNPGLVQFKQSILARPSLRIDLVRDLP